MGENTHLNLLRLVGEALYGERWQSPLASDLGVSDRAVRYWISAVNPCPDDIGTRLLSVVVQKREAMGELEKTILQRLHGERSPT